MGKATALVPAYAEAARLGIEAILNHGSGLVSIDAEFVYHKHVGGGLLRQFQIDESDVTDFQSGNGATGQSWKDEETIVVTGEAAHNAEYGLSYEQQEFFSDLTIVGATPIFDLDGKKTIGVLTASSKQPIDAEEETAIKKEFEAALETTARVLAVTLIAYDLEGAPQR